MELNRIENAISREERNKLNENWDKIAQGVAQVETKANEALSITDALIQGEFDDAALQTSIEEKLNQLESQYAPQLTEVSEQLADKANQSDILKSHKSGQYGLNKVLSGLLNVVELNDVKVWYSGNAFENSPQPSNVIDVSGNDNNGIVDGFAFNSVSGSNGLNGIVTDGLNAFFGTDANISLSNQFTISTSIKINTIPTSLGRVFSLNNDNIYVGLGTSQYLDLVGTASTGRVEAGIEYTITLVSNGTQKKLYLNSLLVLTISDTTICNQVTFGNRNTDKARGLNATYKNAIIFNKALTDAEVFSIHNVLVDKPHTKFSALKWNAMGDSITDANIYQLHVNSKLNFQTVRKYGIGGTKISDPTSTDANSMVNRYLLMDSDADIITIMGGTNDWGSNVVLENENKKDKTTFKGALAVLCEGLLQKYTNKRILFITPPFRFNGSYAENDYGQQFDTNGKTMEDFANAMVEVCGKYGLPCLDLYHNCGWNKVNWSHFLPDGVHPNDAGHRRIASLIIDELERIVY